MTTQPLFGGAITVPLGTSFLDASQIRQIPDNQEVFVDMQTQQSLIFELLEQVEESNEQIAKFHFQQLAEDNDAAESNVITAHKLNAQDTTPLLPHDATEVYILQGTQKVAKFNESNALNTVEIILAVVRLTKVSTDFVISINAPIQLSNLSSEQKSAQDADAISIDDVKQEILTILKGLQVKDWSLFG